MAGLAGLAGVAHGQCTISISGMPDLDQRRDNALPGDGGMYCAPTAFTNLMAYYANRGAPQPTTLNGPRNWQSQSNYNRATNTLATMGTLMGTDAQDGTSGGGFRDGAWLYSIAYAPGRFSTNYYSCSGGDCPSPTEYWLVIFTGGTVATAYGRYEESSPGSGFWTRGGGHVVTLVGVNDPNCTASAEIMYRDPWTDSNNTTQSTFSTTTKMLDRVVANFRSGSGQSYSAGARYMMRANPGRFFDSRLVVYPTFYVTNSGVRADTIQVIRPWVEQGGRGTNRTYTAPAGTGPISDYELTPDMLKLFVITEGAAGTTVQPARLWEVNLVTGVWTQVYSAFNMSDMVFNRFNELYIQEGTTLRVFNIYTSPLTQLGSQTFSQAPDSFAYDDLADQLLVLSPPSAASGLRTLSRRPRLLSGFGQIQTLPSALLGDGSVAPDPNNPGQFWVCGSGQRGVWRLATNAGNLVVNESFNAPAGAVPTGLQVGDDGNVFVVSNGAILEYFEDPNGRFLPVAGSVYAGQPVGTGLNLTRTRTNFDPAIHTGPGWVNLVDPDVNVEVPDCYANCDMSTTTPVLTPADFTCFLGKYRQGLFEANCDGSTVAPFLTPADFTCFLNAYRGGCP